jgi:hypothetical protein
MVNGARSVAPPGSGGQKLQDQLPKDGESQDYASTLQNTPVKELGSRRVAERPPSPSPAPAKNLADQPGSPIGAPHMGGAQRETVEALTLNAFVGVMPPGRDSVSANAHSAPDNRAPLTSTGIVETSDDSADGTEIVTNMDEVEAICKSYIRSSEGGDSCFRNELESCRRYRGSRPLPQFKVEEGMFCNLMVKFDDKLGVDMKMTVDEIIETTDAFIEKISREFGKLVEMVTDTAYRSLDSTDVDRHALFDHLFTLVRDMSPGDAKFAIEAEIVDVAKMQSEERRRYLSAGKGSSPRLETAPPALISRLENFPSSKGSYPFMVNSMRGFATIRFGKLRFPFYQSSGQQDKPGVSRGKWYPCFGISGGWIVKYNVGERLPGNYYGSAKLREAALLLNGVCDMRHTKSLPVFEDEERDVLAFLNRDTRLCADDRYGERFAMALVDLVDANDAKARLISAKKLAELDRRVNGDSSTSAEDHAEFIRTRTDYYLQLISTGDPPEQ